MGPRVVKIVFDGAAMGAKFRSAMNGHRDAMLKAMEESTKELARVIKDRGDADIKAAGKFGPQWVSDFRVEAKGLTITVVHENPAALIHETGGTIKGNPYLWIPLTYTGLKVPPREFSGKLFFVARNSGAPLLLSEADRLPKYFGVTSVRLQKRFHIRSICEQALREFPTIFGRFMKVK